MSPAVQLENVSVEFDGQTILDRVSWTIQSGQRWGILGPNGSGKTTLLRVACGYLWPNAGGRVLRRGVERTDLRELRKSIGWVTSSLAAEIPRRERALDTAVSGKLAQTGLKVFASHPPLPLGEGRSEGGGGEDITPAADLTSADYARAAELLRQLGCGELLDRPFGVLSQGEQQKVLIARARMAEPWLIILDEPCAGLDPGAREDLLHFVDAFARKNPACTLLMVTHHLEEIMPAFERLLVLSAGRVVQAGLADEIICPKLLETLYGVRPQRIEESGGRYWPIW